jgi:ATP-dependent helicase/DNAse subunit B
MPQQRLFVSDSFTVLQDAFVTAVRAIKEADPLAPLTVLVPGNLLALQLRRAVAWAGHGHIGLRVLTLVDFARDVAEDSLTQEGRQPLPPLAAPLIAKKLIREVEASNYFAPLVAQPRFPQSLLSTIADLKQAGIQPQHLHEFVKHTQQGELSRLKIGSLAVLYEHYAHFVVEHGFYDNDDLLERATLVLETQPLTSPLFLYGFYDFTPQQRRMIAAALKGCDVLVFFPWRAGAAYEYATPTLTWLTNLGLQYTPLTVTETRRNALAEVQAHLFEKPNGRSAKSGARLDNSLLLISAPGVNRETREIGRTIVELVRHNGLRFHEIGVLLRDPATYGALLNETLAELGIPCFLYGGLPLIRTQAGHSLHLLCQVLAEDYTRSRVIEFLQVAAPPFAELLGDAAPHADLARWEAFAFEAGVVKGAKEWRERLPRLDTNQNASDAEGKYGAEDRQTLQTFVDFMQGFLAASEDCPPVNSWHAWAEYTLRLLRSYIAVTAQTAEVEDTLVRLGQLDSLGETIAPISFAEWSKAVTAALTATTVSVGAFEKEGVCLADLLACRGVRFRAVIVPGLSEGSFPKIARQDPLLLDTERQHIAEVVERDLPQRSRLHEEERLLFTLATQSAIERLILTYPRLDHSDGQAQTPSFYLLHLIEVFSGKTAFFSDLEEWAVPVPLVPFYAGPPDQAVDALEFHLASVELARMTGEPAPLGYLPASDPFFTRAFSAAPCRWDMSVFTSFDGVLEDESVRRRLLAYLFPHGLLLSASALETYARCPFRYFLSAGLGLVPREDPEEVLTLQPRERGALLHDILHDFFVRLRQTGRLPIAGQDRTLLESLLKQVAEEHCEAFTRTKATGFPLLWELEQERMLEQLSLLLERECASRSEFLPTAFEAHFGTDAAEEPDPFFPAAPVRFEVDDAPVLHLRGRIDRVDVSTDARHARLLDYKTGKLIRGQFAGGTSLQLPLYLFAARALRPDLHWVSAEHVYVNPTNKKAPLAFSADTWSESLATLRQIVSALVHGIRSGCFPATPDFCFPCPFSLICGTQVAARFAHKQEDPRLDWWRRVRAMS